MANQVATTAPRSASRIAGMGSQIVFVRAILTDFMEYETVFLLIVAVPSVAAELWFTVWLLMRGGAEQEVLR